MQRSAGACMELAVSLRACWRTSSCCRRVGSRSRASSCFTSRRRCTRLRITCTRCICHVAAGHGDSVAAIGKPAAASPRTAAAPGSGSPAQASSVRYELQGRGMLRLPLQRPPPPSPRAAAAPGSGSPAHAASVTRRPQGGGHAAAASAKSATSFILRRRCTRLRITCTSCARHAQAPGRGAMLRLPR